MIYMTGDCHGDYLRFTNKNFPAQKEMSREDYVIVCGDFGLWHDDDDERRLLDWLANKRFTLLFVDGNHENFDRLYSGEFPVVNFHGGKAHKIRENVFHLMRGEVFELCGKKFFAFGGGRSQDIQDGVLEPSDFESYDDLLKAYIRLTKAGKMVRVNHDSWWKQEMPSRGEMDHGLNSLEKHGFNVDFIVSHCCPQHVVTSFISKNYKPDALSEYLNAVDVQTNFEKWFFGHYHQERAFPGGYVMLYEKIVQIA